MRRAAAAVYKALHLCIVAVLVGRLAIRDFVVPAAQRIHFNTSQQSAGHSSHLNHTITRSSSPGISLQASTVRPRTRHHQHCHAEAPLMVARVC